MGSEGTRRGLKSPGDTPDASMSPPVPSSSNRCLRSSPGFIFGRVHVHITSARGVSLGEVPR